MPVPTPFLLHRVCPRPLYAAVSAGFPSPAEDWSDEALDLNDLAVRNPAATFFVRAQGDSMREAGIFHNDILVVDRSLEARPNQVVIAVVGGEFLVKYLRGSLGNLRLEAANPHYSPLVLQAEQDPLIWGVVTHVLHSL